MRSKKGLKLNLELQGTLGERFFLFVQGLKPQEDVELVLQWKEKTFPLESTVTSLGDLCCTILFTDELAGGEAKLVLKRKNETVVFPFQYGEPALAYMGACCFEIK
jgi:hypothetical protein